MSTASNPLDSLREIVLSLFPWLLKLGVWTYRVERVNNDGTLDLAPTSSIPPRLPAVPQWLVGGVEVYPVVGSLVGVVYLDAPVPDGKPIPAIVAFAPLRVSVPFAVTIDAQAKLLLGPTVGEVDIGGTSGPSAARRGDGTGYRYLQVITAMGVVTSVVESWSEGNGAASLWVPTATGPLPPVNGVTVGTAEHITGGSNKVQIA